MKRLYLIPFTLSALLLTACNTKEEDEVAIRPPVSVHTENVIVTDMPIYLHAVGTVKADKTIYLQSRVAGELIEVLVEDGDYVEEGQILFKLDKTPLEAAYAAARASYDGNRAQLKKAQDDLKRIKNLSESSFASDDQREQAQLRVDMLNAALRADNANIKNANLSLSYADIKAPISGKIGAISTDIGNYIAPGQSPLTTLENAHSVKVDFALPENELTRLRSSFNSGDIVVKAITSTGVEVEGIVTFLGNVNTASGTILMTAKFDNKDSKLWVGQFVDIVITAEVLKDANTVSEKAVILGPDGLFVYVVEDNTAIIRLVESNLEEGGRRVISKGINTHDVIIRDGHVRLYDGAKVEIIPNNTAFIPASKDEIEVPIIPEPLSNEHIIIESESIEPEIIEPEIVEPEIVEPEIIEPEIIEPEIVAPAPAKPEVVEQKKSEIAPPVTEIIKPDLTNRTPATESIYMPIQQSLINSSSEDTSPKKTIPAPVKPANPEQDIITVTPLSSTPVNNRLNTNPTPLAPRTFTPAGTLKPLTEQESSPIATHTINTNRGTITTASSYKPNSVILKFHQ